MDVPAVVLPILDERVPRRYGNEGGPAIDFDMSRFHHFQMGKAMKPEPNEMRRMA